MKTCDGPTDSVRVEDTGLPKPEAGLACVRSIRFGSCTGCHKSMRLERSSMSERWPPIYRYHRLKDIQCTTPGRSRRMREAILTQRTYSRVINRRQSLYDSPKGRVRWVWGIRRGSYGAPIDTSRRDIVS